MSPPHYPKQIKQFHDIRICHTSIMVEMEHENLASEQQSSSQHFHCSHLRTSVKLPIRQCCLSHDWQPSMHHPPTAWLVLRMEKKSSGLCQQQMHLRILYTGSQLFYTFSCHSTTFPKRVIPHACVHLRLL